MRDPYWSERCKCGDGKTNLECVKEAAEATQTPLIEAMKIFRPTSAGQAVSGAWTNWKQGQWADHV
jgi:hypothetical protein